MGDNDLTFTWRIRDASTQLPVAGAVVTMTRIQDGMQFSAVSGVDGYAYVNGPILPYDEYYDSVVTAEGYEAYALLKANWGDGGLWQANMIPTSVPSIPSLTPVIGGIAFLGWMLLSDSG